MTRPTEGMHRHNRLGVAAVQSRHRAERLQFVAIAAGAYSILALIAAIVQARRLSAAVEGVAATVGWQTWWEITALIAAVICAGCVIGAQILGRMAAAITAFAEPGPEEIGQDDYR